ncbi:MAG: hypothetical protein MZU95_13355 [Desulfomicrobium escambiense]|nr:hypothetical protein [Desulfomicrobium escambiense]
MTPNDCSYRYQSQLQAASRCDMTTVGQIEKKTQAPRRRPVPRHAGLRATSATGRDAGRQPQHRAGSADAPGCKQQGHDDDAHQHARCTNWTRRPATPARASTTATRRSTTCCATA